MCHCFNLQVFGFIVAFNYTKPFKVDIQHSIRVVVRGEQSYSNTMLNHSLGWLNCTEQNSCEPVIRVLCLGSPLISPSFDSVHNL